MIGGSYASLRVSDDYAEFENIEVDAALGIVTLVSNDIDVFYGEFTGDEAIFLVVDNSTSKSVLSRKFLWKLTLLSIKT